MSDPQAKLKDLKPKYDFLVAIDSDGCAFDTMEIKHKECFIPNIIKYWNLQPISKYARAAAEFVNLYSRWRGVNRFPALTMTFDLLRDWSAVQRRKFPIPEAQPLREWIKRETKLGNPALKSEVERTADPVLKQALIWSKAVNNAIADLVHDVPPFPYVRESLMEVTQWADVLVCSATPTPALQREWEEHDIAKYTVAIAGQEMGSKREHLALVKDKYPVGNVIMIGDAFGDLQAAHSNGLLFFPINPGEEEKSWEAFYRQHADMFQVHKYTPDVENQLVATFEKFLPDTPPWEKK
jgi:phosphoglycolate phosphatase-like HAD superfamily hydrolase